MLKKRVDAHVYYKHAAKEVEALSDAVIPLWDHVKAVSGSWDRAKMKGIMTGDYFRVREADRMRCLLLRATRHARAHLSEYFPTMREVIMADATRLEEAVDNYWNDFRHRIDEVAPRR
jgi:hypothetical protein